MENFISVPFKTSTDSGFSEIEGIGKFSPAGVILEFESKFLGLIKTGVKENRVTLGEILDVRFRKGFFKMGARIEIRLKSLARLSELPGEKGRLMLKLRRVDFELGREAAGRLEKWLAAHREALPPAHTPVSVLFDESEAETRELNE